MSDDDINTEAIQAVRRLLLQDQKVTAGIPTVAAFVNGVQEIIDERDALLAVSEQVNGTFWEALKGLKLTHLRVDNPGSHFTDAIGELRAELVERDKAILAQAQVIGKWSMDYEQLRAEIEAVLASMPGAIRVREGGGPENLSASLAVSVAALVDKLRAREATP